MEFKTEPQPKLYIVTYYEKGKDSKGMKYKKDEEIDWVFRHETYTNPGSFIEKVKHLSDHQGERYKDINPGVVEHKPLSIESVLNPFG